MTDRVMVDLETLGLDRDSAILSIGAVRFDQDGIEDEWYREISVEDCQKWGRSIDAETLEWWLGQDDDVADVLVGGDDLPSVLDDFVTWFGDADEIWANSPSFDCEILKHALEKTGTEIPWEFYEERDVRTIRELPVDVEVERTGPEHDALADAKHQALVVARTLASLDGGDRP